MRLCFNCLLRERPLWFGRYMMGWYALLVYAAVVFFLPDNWLGLVAQGLFFAILFPWTLWPVVAAIRPPKEEWS
jgi:hypothetical protein